MAGPVVVLAVVVLLLLMLGPWPGPDRTWLVVDVGSVLADAFVLVAATWRFRTSTPGPARRGWALIGLAVAAYLVGDALWLQVDLAGQTMPYPSTADAFFLAAAVPALLGLLQLVAAEKQHISWVRLLLDAAVLSSSLTLISFMLILRELFESLGTGTGAVVNASYPVIDLLFVCVVGLLLMRGSGIRSRPDLLLVGAGFISYAVADSAFALIALEGGSYDSSVLADVPYVVAPLLIGLGALARPGPSRGPASGERVLGALVPDLAVLAALVVSLVQGLETWRDSVLLTQTLVLAVARQVHLASENVGLRRDLERRVAERAAENEQLTLRDEQILQSAGEGILGIDRVGRISFVNRVGAQVLAADVDDLVGRDACLVLHGSATHPGIACPLMTAGARGVVADLEDEFVRSGADPVPVELTVSSHRHLSEPARVIVFRDVTERRATEKLKSEFISIVSHELRTPLTSIHGALSLMADGDVGELSAPVSGMVSMALRGTDRLSRLVDAILVMDRLDSGKLPMAIGDHDVGPLLTSVVSDLGPVASAEGLSLSSSPVGARIRVDPDRFVQVLNNLVGNAVAFTPRGGSVEVCAEERDGQLVVSVADTGAGVPEELREVVFERFRQLEDSTSRQREGSGLGLSISRALVEQMGGRIWVEANPGGGSLFRFTVPLAPPVAPPVGVGPAAAGDERAEVAGVPLAAPPQRSGTNR